MYLLDSELPGPRGHSEIKQTRAFVPIPVESTSAHAVTQHLTSVMKWTPSRGRFQVNLF